jgi:hypothetical protein
MLLGLAPFVELVILQSSAPPKTKTMLRWAKLISHCGVISATFCLRNDYVPKKIHHQGCTEQA